MSNQQQQQEPPQADAFSSFTKGVGSFFGKVQKGLEDKQKEMAEAKQAKQIGKIWDKKEKQWVFYYLDNEWEELMEKEKVLGNKQQRGGGTSSSEEERPVKDRTVRGLRSYVVPLCVKCANQPLKVANSACFFNKSITIYWACLQMLPT